jgi:hypothetical protein
MNYPWLKVDTAGKTYDDVSGRRALLNGILHAKDIPQVDAALISQAIGTQNGLAKLEYASLGIRPLSLNTLKKRANSRHQNWVDLDRLRVEALEHLMVLEKLRSADVGASRRTIAWYEIENSRLNGELKKSQQDLVVMTRAYDRAFFNARSLAQMSGKAALKELCSQREEEIRSELRFMSKHEDDE